MNLASVFLLFLAFGFVSCSDEETTEGGIRLKVVGRSGKIKVANASYVNVDADPDRIMISFDSITEVDQNGNMVGNTGNPKHSFNSFASQDFQFSPLINTEFQDLDVQKFNFSCTLGGLTSKIEVTMYIFREGGNITVFGDNMRVRQGQIKFNIRLSDWQFCGHDVPCSTGQQDEVGEFVDFDIEVKSKGNANKTADDRKQNDDDLDEYDLGVGFFRISSRYEWDDVESEIHQGDMPDSYPLVTTKGVKQIFTFRFARFNSYADYDPIIQYADVDGDGEGDGDGDGGGGAGKTGISLIVFLLMAVSYLLQ